MLKEQLAVMDLLKNLIRGNMENISKVTYTPQKPAFKEEAFSQPFPRMTPESQGVPSRRLAAFFEELAGDNRTDLHHVMVLRHGNVIGEADVAPYGRDMWHASYSMCKTITGMAIGMLIEEGKLSLDDKVLHLLDSKSLLAGIRQKNLKVEHLLTMTSGVTFNETGIVSGDDWTASYLQAGVKGTPGTKFEYNSMNTYILSAIVTKLTGESMMDYLRPRLWEPMGITQVFWEACPKGITKGGWGLFIGTEDAAKLGQLYLQKGNWKGRQLIPESWVETATSKHIDTPESMGPYGYGYQVWMGGRPGSYTFNGMLGQNIVVYPDIDMVVASNAGSDELFQSCVLLNIVKKYFEDDFQPGEELPEDPAGLRKLRDVEASLRRDGRRGVPELAGTGGRGGWKAVSCVSGSGVRRSGRTIRKGSLNAWNRPRKNSRENHFLEEEKLKRLLNGRVYRLEQTHVGLSPLVLQVFHNNYTEGIHSVGFHYENKKFYVSMEEGGMLHRLEIGFGRAAETEVFFHGEPYLLGTEGEFTKDEDGYPVLKLDIAFLEEAVRRKMKCIFRDHGERIEIHWDETPGGRMIKEGLGSLLSDSLKNGLMEAIRDKLGVDLAAILADRTIHPIVTGSCVPEKEESEEA
ncbi:beta-lactamase family protein [Lacrimispora sp. NSJ-141]|uniref:Beta-lactamase family protein n=1 Tax=Lientehia hominis TaxID=2897778 RepID=A0AAP2W893_9FIRM|nr:serine hydrolase [Lientehia hominis]MCD2493243.1 beta-lactamase family protein [Lientehia hominis]